MLRVTRELKYSKSSCIVLSIVFLSRFEFVSNQYTRAQSTQSENSIISLVDLSFIHSVREVPIQFVYEQPRCKQFCMQTAAIQTRLLRATERVRHQPPYILSLDMLLPSSCQFRRMALLST